MDVERKFSIATIPLINHSLQVSSMKELDDTKYRSVNLKINENFENENRINCINRKNCINHSLNSRVNKTFQKELNITAFTFESVDTFARRG